MSCCDEVRERLERYERLAPLCGDGAGNWCYDDPDIDGLCQIHWARGFKTQKQLRRESQDAAEALKSGEAP